MLGVNLSLPTIAAARPAFSPLALFAAGEQGVWYDPSDFSTMFQDSAGTTPVTAVEQRVGLILDKSKGLAITATSIDAKLNTATWTKGTGWTAPTSRSLVCDGSQGAATDCSATFVKSSSEIIRWTFTVTAISGTLFVYPTGGGASVITTTGTKTIFSDAASNFNIFRMNGAGQTCTITNISIVSISGNHATQLTFASQPILRQDANGKYYLAFDGTDDSLATGTITPGVDKVQVFAGVRKLSDAARGILVEHGSSFANGSFAINAPNVSLNNLAFGSTGSASGVYAIGSATSPTTKLVTGLGDISGDTSIIRLNGVQADQSVSDQGTGNYGAYPLYIGRRAGSTLPFNGYLYSLIARFSSANLDAATIAKTETWVNSKTGAY